MSVHDCFVSMFGLHQEQEQKQTPKQSSTTKILECSMRQTLIKVVNICQELQDKTKTTNHQGNKSPRQQSCKMAIERILHWNMTSLNQLQKHSSQFYNYLQSIKPFIVKISTHWKCCELIISKVPGMGNKKVSKLFKKDILQKNLSFSLTATFPHLPLMQ